MVRLPLFRGSTRCSSTSQHDSGKNVKNNHNKPRRRKSFVDILLIPPYNGRRRQNQMDTAYSIIKRSMVRRAEEGRHCHEHENITTNNNNDHQPFRKKDPKLPTYDDNLDDVVDVNVNDNEIDNTRYGPFIKKWPRRKTKTKSKVTTNNNVQQSPTNTLCGRTTVTDESSSTQYNCRSRSSSSNNEESSPRDSHNMMSSGSLLTFRDIFRFNNNKSIDKVDLRCCEDGDNDDDKYDPDDRDNPNDDKDECAYVHHRDQQDHRTEEESIKNKEPQKDDDDHDHDHNLQELPIPRSEIIGKLFPMGYPNRFKSSDMISSADHHRQNLNSMITDDSKITRTKLEPSISEQEEDEDSKATSISSTSFDRSEIISSLFPMGHPNDIRKKQESGSNFFIIVKDIHTSNKQRNFLSTPCRDIHSSSLKVQYPPTFDTIATSSDVDHQQQGREEQVLETTRPKNIYAYNPSECKETKERSPNCDCNDNVIGMVISFDPTWDLLTEETGPIDHTTSIMVRSRLKKFHEIENYADSLLGKISAEESSNDESILVDMFAGLKSNHESELLLSSSSLEELMFSISDPILDLQSSKNYHNFHPMVVKEKNCVDNFELGFHFDSERYPSSVPSEEIEICFHPDDETSIEYDVSEEEGSMRKHYIDNGISIKSNRLDDDFGCVRNADQEQETSFDEYTDCFEYESDNMHTPSTADTSISLQPYHMLCREQLFRTDNLSFVH